MRDHTRQFDNRQLRSEPVYHGAFVEAALELEYPAKRVGPLGIRHRFGFNLADVRAMQRLTINHQMSRGIEPIAIG